MMKTTSTLFSTPGYRPKASIGNSQVKFQADDSSKKQAQIRPPGPDEDQAKALRNLPPEKPSKAWEIARRLAHPLFDLIDRRSKP